MKVRIPYNLNTFADAVLYTYIPAPFDSPTRQHIAFSLPADPIYEVYFFSFLCLGETKNDVTVGDILVGSADLTTVLCYSPLSGRICAL